MPAANPLPTEKSQKSTMSKDKLYRKCEMCSHPIQPATRNVRSTISLPSIFSLRTRRSTSFAMNRITTFTAICLTLTCFVTIAFGRSVQKDECDPQDIHSCDFGATCQRVYGTHRNGNPYNRCVCPKIDCFSAGLFDPVCGEDGRTQKSYFNVLCLMLKECELKRPIRQVCNGRCSSASCREASAQTVHHTRCPKEEIGLCLNGGLCVHHRLLNESRCRCPSDYTGDRCESKRLPMEVHDEGDKKCSQSGEILTIFAIVLLSVVLLMITICLCMRYRKGKNDDDKLWPSSTLERDETTPLRDTKRTDFLFPGGTNEDTGTN